MAALNHRLLLPILITISLITSEGANDKCGGINLENFFSFLDSGAVILDQIHFIKNGRCFCTHSTDKLCAVKCFPCDDNQERCQIYGTCCGANGIISPDHKMEGAVAPSTTGIASLVGPEVDNSPKRLLCYMTGSNLSPMYLVLNSCPNDYNEDIIRKKCEDESHSSQVTIDTATFVMDENTNVSYGNSYCAECNKALKVRKWVWHFDCDTFFYVREAVTEEELWKLSMDPKSKCKLKQKPPDSSSRSCEPAFHTDKIINTCSVKGQETFSTHVEQACLSLPNDIKLRVLHGTNTFKNIFCLICNLYKTTNCIDGSGGTTTEVQLPFSFLFGMDNDGFSGSASSSASECSEQEWLGPRGNCRALMCVGGKVMNSTHCKTALKEITGLPYRLTLLLIPLDQKNNTLPYVEAQEIICEKIREQLHPKSSKLEIRTLLSCGTQNISLESKLKKTTIFSVQDSLLSFIWVDVFIVAEKKPPRDDFENDILDMYNRPILNVTTQGQGFILLRPYFVNEMCDPCESQTRFNCTRETCVTDGSKIFKYVNESDFIPIHPTLTCPYVTLSAEELQEVIDPWPVPHVTKIKLHLGTDKIVEITESSEINQVSHGDNGTFYICVGLLKKLEFSKTSLSDVVQYFLTVACISASILCLFATITTYCLFPDLRRLAGCNTLGLSVSLFVAQILLLVANTIRGPSILCTAMGVITHYSWLVMFTWTFICCLHMLQVFTNTNLRTMTASHEMKRVALNVAMSLTVPMLVVIAIMVTNVIKYDQKRIGYGYNSCAMDDVFAIHGPLIFVTTCNIIFFLIVIFKIWGVRRMQTTDELRNRNREEFVVYMKLSTLTGMFWLLVLLGEALRNDIVRNVCGSKLFRQETAREFCIDPTSHPFTTRCFAIVANGCQGVFIFASFTANRRVLRYYMQKFNLDWISNTHSNAEAVMVSKIDSATPQLRKATRHTKDKDLDAVQTSTMEHSESRCSQGD